MSGFTKSKIESLFRALNKKLLEDGVKGELYVVGGAVMCMVFEARESTKDIDALFKPTKKIREAAHRVADEAGIDTSWLNDAVKGYLSDSGTYSNFLELSNLRVLTADAKYLLAMKCLAMRIGEEFSDEADVRYLIRNLNINDYKTAIQIISKYYPLDRFPQKTLYALEEIVGS